MDLVGKFLEVALWPAIQVMDQTINMHPAIGFGALIAVSLGYTAVIATPFMLIAHYNSKELERVQKKLDNTTTFTFNSKANPEEYSQKELKAVESAMDLVDRLGNGLTYNDEGDCKRYHSTYKKHEYTVPITVVVGKNTMIIPQHRIEYIPAIEGFMASNDNPSLAVPLYCTNQRGIGMRPDGMKVKIA